MKAMRSSLFLLVLLLSLGISTAYGQSENDEPATYEELYDDPYGINKLFVGFQPFYGELFATNVNAGYGLEAHYYHTTKFDVKAHLRKTYSSQFFDFNRQLANKNSSVSNKPEVFNYYEIGGTYHIRDFDVYSKTKFFLRKKKYTDNRWAATVPEMVQVDGKLRKIIGARVGAVIWNSTIDVNRTLEAQGLTNADLINENGEGLPDTFIDDNGEVQQLNSFSNLYSINVYVGGSLTLIRNLAVDFDNYIDASDDNILNLFFDIMFAPSMRLDPILYNGQEYSTAAISTNNIGGRIGVDGKFNRKWGWAYGGEMGYRPSIEGRSFFMMLKLSVPVYSTNLERKGAKKDE